MNIRVVILAGDQETGMFSDIPNALHLLAGSPIIHYSVEAARGVTRDIPVVVVGDDAEAFRSELGDRFLFAVQEQQAGIFQALWAAETLLAGKTDLVVIISAQMPLLSVETLGRMVETQKTNPGPLTILTMMSEKVPGLENVARGSDGCVQAISNAALDTPGQCENIELCTGVFCIEAEWLRQTLKRTKASPMSEQSLSVLVQIAVSDGLRVQPLLIADPTEVIRVDNRLQLAQAEKALGKRITAKWMGSGVTIVDPNTTYVEPEVVIGRDTVIYPNTHLRGSTVIGTHCKIGPNTIIENTHIGNFCMVLASVLERAVLEDNVEIGPFGHLRKGAHLANGVHMGNFGEVKNSYLGPGTKMGHFSYLGDATIEEDVNIGAGTITCNYDGQNKHPTLIGKNAFIGSDTMLIAPLTIGEGASTGAGAVVTHDVPPHTVVVGVPARQIKKKDKSE
ncbi:MAG: bifunctional UDP-N-acetylglucosamine diphosphorylase/glucosamine-1-phosphate N-acetyltransferase GlmU [Anaerolineaceae bacterium]|nr:bifunctional UDP-N-acetylglucosamine diphosphorylase/glucosamine-1-phosphate N-acetyltransferase GlmU [Anaerolineaceae bacterium]